MNILVIEDHTLIRELLILACGQICADAEVDGAATGSAGLEVCKRKKPWLILLDLVLPECEGLELFPKLLEASPEARIIALSSHTDEFTLHRALRLRVHGFVDKNEQPILVLREAITEVLAGRRYYTPVVQRALQSLRADPVAFTKVLTDREVELLALIGAGLSNESVAEKVGLSARTIKNHRHNIMVKLGIHSTPELIRYAVEKGLARMEPHPAGPRPAGG